MSLGIWRLQNSAEEQTDFFCARRCFLFQISRFYAFIFARVSDATVIEASPFQKRIKRIIFVGQLVTPAEAEMGAKKQKRSRCKTTRVRLARQPEDELLLCGVSIVVTVMTQRSAVFCIPPAKRICILKKRAALTGTARRHCHGT